MYQKNFKESWRLLFKNLELFVPDTVFYIVNLIVVVFILNQLGLVNLLTSSQDLVYSKDALIEFLSSLDPVFFIKAIFYFLLFFAVMFLTGSGTDTAKFYMMRQLLLKKKINFSDAFAKGAREFYFRYLGLKVIKFLIFIIPVFLFYKIIGYFMPTPELFLEALLSKAILLIISLLLSLPFIIFFSLSFYFSEAALFLQKLTIKDSLKYSYKFMRNNFLPLIFTMLIIFAVNLFVSLFFDIIGVIITSFVINILSFIAFVITALWADLFTFGIYSELEKIKH